MLLLLGHSFLKFEPKMFIDRMLWCFATRLGNLPGRASARVDVSIGDICRVQLELSARVAELGSSTPSTMPWSVDFYLRELVPVLEIPESLSGFGPFFSFLLFVWLVFFCLGRCLVFWIIARIYIPGFYLLPPALKQDTALKTGSFKL